MFKDILTNVKTVAIGGHVRPDGDCVGSCMGLYQYIRENFPEVEVDVYLEEIPDVFLFIDATKEIKHEIEQQKDYDLFIALDCGSSDRLGFSEALFHRAKATFCIDHHISNEGFADENHIVPEASSTSELVCRLMEETDISKEVATCLYLGIVHDTGVFQYSNTSPETMEIAATLMRKGVEGSYIIEKTYYEKTYAQHQVLGKALLESALLLEGACIAFCLDQKTMNQYGVEPKDLDGIVSHLRMTKGVEVAIFIYELGIQKYKVSMRSNGLVDVSLIAQHFHGGGHKKAAGVTLEGTAEEVIDKLLEQIKVQM